MYKADVFISLKKTVADPQGQTIKHALESLNYKGISLVRAGKLVSISLDAGSKDEAAKAVDEMCKKLLANPVIEDYRFEIKEA